MFLPSKVKKRKRKSIPNKDAPISPINYHFHRSNKNEPIGSQVHSSIIMTAQFTSLPSIVVREVAADKSKADLDPKKAHRLRFRVWTRLFLCSLVLLFTTREISTVHVPRSTNLSSVVWRSSPGHKFYRARVGHKIRGCRCSLQKSP